MKIRTEIDWIIALIGLAMWAVSFADFIKGEVTIDSIYLVLCAIFTIMWVSVYGE